MKTFFCTFALLLSCMVTVCSAESGDAPSDSIFTPVSIKASGNAIANADFSTSGGSARVTSGQLRLRAGDFSLRYERNQYSWDDVNRLNFGNGVDDPWKSFTRLRLGYDHDGEISEDWLYSVGIAGTSSFEKDMSGSYGAALRGGATYLFNENWAATFGAAVFINNVRTSLTPYLGISYENFDKDGSGLFMTLGAPSTEAGYAFSEDARLYVSFDMNENTYRLSDDSAVVRKGYMESSSMKAGLYYDWDFADSWSLSLGPEIHFNREMRLYDRKGKRTGGTIKQDNALGGGLQIGYTF